jgi:hypothetical protein
MASTADPLLLVRPRALGRGRQPPQQRFAALGWERSIRKGGLWTLRAPVLSADRCSTEMLRRERDTTSINNARSCGWIPGVLAAANPLQIEGFPYRPAAGARPVQTLARCRDAWSAGGRIRRLLMHR